MTNNTATTFDLAALLQHENEELASRLIPATVYVGVLMIVGFHGNVAVLFFYRRKATKSINNLSLSFLACCDLIVCCIAMPSEIVDLILPLMFENSAACKAFEFVHHFSSILSGCTLLIIAVDRYLRVCRPFRSQMKKKHLVIACSVCVFVSFLLSGPAVPLYGAQRINVTHVTGATSIGFDCTFTDEKHFELYILIFGTFQMVAFLLTVICLFVLYFLIGRTILEQKRFRKRYVKKPSCISPFVLPMKALRRISLSFQESKNVIDEVGEIEISDPAKYYANDDKYLIQQTQDDKAEPLTSMNTPGTIISGIETTKEMHIKDTSTNIDKGNRLHFVASPSKQDGMSLGHKSLTPLHQEHQNLEDVFVGTNTVGLSIIQGQHSISDISILGNIDSIDIHEKCKASGINSMNDIDSIAVNGCETMIASDITSSGGVDNVAMSIVDSIDGVDDITTETRKPIFVSDINKNNYIDKNAMNTCETMIVSDINGNVGIDNDTMSIHKPTAASSIYNTDGVENMAMNIYETAAASGIYNTDVVENMAMDIHESTAAYDLYSSCSADNMVMNVHEVTVASDINSIDNVHNITMVRHERILAFDANNTDVVGIKKLHNHERIVTSDINNSDDVDNMTTHIHKTSNNSVHGQHRVSHQLPISNSACNVSTNKSSSNSKHPFQTSKYTFIMFAITLMFILSYLPYFAVTIWRIFARDRNTELTYGIQIALRSYLVNSTINPIIYGMFNPSFRKFLKSLLRCKTQSESSQTFRTSDS